MALPDIWHYRSDTGVLLGPGKADQSPLDPPGVWLIPAYATEIEPPPVPDGQQAVFDGAWTLEDIPPPPEEPEVETRPAEEPQE